MLLFTYTWGLLCIIYINCVDISKMKVKRSIIQIYPLLAVLKSLITELVKYVDIAAKPTVGIVVANPRAIDSKMLGIFEGFIISMNCLASLGGLPSLTNLSPGDKIKQYLLNDFRNSTWSMFLLPLAGSDR